MTNTSTLSDDPSTDRISTVSAPNSTTPYISTASAKVSTTKVGTTNTGTAKASSTKASSTKVRATNVGSTNVGSSKVGNTKAGASDVGPTAGEKWSRGSWLLLLAVCLVILLDGLDVSMVGVALPSIGTELGLETNSLQWLVSAYVLGYGSLLLLAPRFDDVDRRGLGHGGILPHKYAYAWYVDALRPVALHDV